MAFLYTILTILWIMIGISLQVIQAVSAANEQVPLTKTGPWTLTAKVFFWPVEALGLLFGVMIISSYNSANKKRIEMMRKKKLGFKE